jgi:membrane-associated phospholipid phosphatase
VHDRPQGADLSPNRARPVDAFATGAFLVIVGRRTACHASLSSVTLTWRPLHPSSSSQFLPFALRRRLSSLTRFLAARLDRQSYVGLHLTLSLVLAAAAVWASRSLLDAVLDNATLVHADLVIDAWIHSRVNPTGLTVSRIISDAGSPAVMALIGVIGGIVLIVRRRTTLLATWVAVFGGGWILERVLKVVVHRMRPAFTPTRASEFTMSFPSGHAMMCVMGVGMLVYLLMVPRPPARRWRDLLIGLAASIVLVVGISRVYLGAHYPSDVLGGYAFGTAWLATCIGMSGVALHRKGRSLVR